jgi:hypothetical protein
MTVSPAEFSHICKPITLNRVVRPWFTKALMLKFQILERKNKIGTNLFASASHHELAKFVAK